MNNKTTNEIILTADIRKELERRIKSFTISTRDHFRAKIILLRNNGKSKTEIKNELKIIRPSIDKWINRFIKKGLKGLEDAPGRGRQSWLSAEKVNFVITNATQPPEHMDRWSTRTMAKKAGISQTSVLKIWHANEIKPHITKIFKLSKDKNFEVKFWDIIGLYLNPPDKALVFCCDEKSQCQALERSQPCLPLGIGHVRTKTHDYYRHGTTTLFAALNYLEGTLISSTHEKHRHEEWLKFLEQIDEETPSFLDLHLIVDNYSTHKHKAVKEWLEKHPRFHIHFTPTGSSWMNLVEIFFADITNDVIRDGSFNSLKKLENAITNYMSERNSNPKRYVWKAEGQIILDKINRARKKPGWDEYCKSNLNS